MKIRKNIITKTGPAIPRLAIAVAEGPPIDSAKMGRKILIIIPRVRNKPRATKPSTARNFVHRAISRKVVLAFSSISSLKISCWPILNRSIIVI